MLNEDCFENSKNPLVRILVGRLAFRTVLCALTYLLLSVTTCLISLHNTSSLCEWGWFSGGPDLGQEAPRGLDCVGSAVWNLGLC